MMNAPYLTLSFCRPNSARVLFADIAQEIGVGFEHVPTSIPTAPGLLMIKDQISRDWVEGYDLSEALEAHLQIEVGGHRRDAVLSYVDFYGEEPELRNVTLSISAPEFSHIPEESMALPIGLDASNLFIALCNSTRPLYASIIDEYDLETPTQLVKAPDSYAFRDFYLDTTFFGEVISPIVSLSQGAFVKYLDGGIYISSTSYFNTGGEGLQAPTPKTSALIGRLVASVLGKGA